LLLGHFWSLCVEEQFYLVWPWVVLWVRDRRKLVSICLFFVVLCPIARVIAESVMPGFMVNQDVIFRWTAFRVDALLLGALIALVHNDATAARLHRFARTGFAILGGLALCRYAVWTFAPAVLSSSPKWRNTWGLSFVDLLSACVIIMALRPRSAASLVFTSDPLRRIGKISYGAYVFHDIFHMQFLWLAIRWGAASTDPASASSNAAVALAALVVTLLLASCSYRWYESIFLRWKQRWTRPVRMPALNQD
jgi:peptidoglycan/LPS O-acetylase OafA/YrhL